MSLETDPDDARGPDDFAHTIAVIQSDASVRTHLVPEIRRSLQRGQHVLMVVSESVGRLVRSDLGSRVPGVEWGDPAAFYTRLGPAFERFRRYLAERHEAGQQVHVIAEPELADGAVADRTHAYLPYESICNETYAPYGSPVTCIWNTGQHPAAVLEQARIVHGHELTAAGRVRNEAYQTPDEFLTGRAQAPLEPVPALVDHDVILHDLLDLRVLRRILATWTTRHGFQDEVAADVSVAVTEIATNALIHGGTPARARCWHAGDTLIVQLDDPGGRPLSPTAGYRRPAATSAAGGRGLWLARQLADSVMTASAAGRTSVRLYFPHRIMHHGQP
jgi:anti-sigma regulatory factor (Ser/Thr protein kinase)